jgi:hypothetical protein
MGALAVIDIQERDGHYRQRHEVQRWPVSIGRGLDNDIVLDDPHVAARHLDLSEVSGQVRFTVGETRNGVRIDGQMHAAGGSGIWPGDAELHLGHTILKLRTAQDPLPAETPLFISGFGLSVAAMLLLGLLNYALLGWDHWLGLSGELAWWRVLAPLYIAFTFFLALWVAGWSLISKLFTKQLQYARHLRLALLWLMLMMVAEELAKLCAFAFNWPMLDRHFPMIQLAGVGVLVAAHLRIVAPRRTPQMAAAVFALTLAGLSAYMLSLYGKTRQLSEKHYMSSLYPPGLRWGKGVRAETFVTEAGALKVPLDEQAKDPAEEDREYPE